MSSDSLYGQWNFAFSVKLKFMESFLILFITNFNFSAQDFSDNKFSAIRIPLKKT